MSTADGGSGSEVDDDDGVAESDSESEFEPISFSSAETCLSECAQKLAFATPDEQMRALRALSAYVEAGSCGAGAAASLGVGAEARGSVSPENCFPRDFCFEDRRSLLTILNVVPRPSLGIALSVCANFVIESVSCSDSCQWTIIVTTELTPLSNNTFGVDAQISR